MAMTATGWLLLSGIKRSAHEEALAQGRLLAHTLASSFSVPLSRGQHELIQRQVDQIAELPDMFPQVARVVVVGQTGRVVAHTDPTRFNEPWADPDPAHTEAFLEPAPGAPHQAPMLVVEVPIEAAVRFGTVEIAMTVPGPFEAARQSSRLVLFGMIVTVVVLSATLAVLLHLLVVRPLRRLAEAVKTWKGDPLAPRMRGGPEEVHTVAAAFDELAERLHEHTVGLEQMVGARTRALSDAYEKLQVANRQLQELASTDGLTGLANRRAFSDRLGTEVARAQRSGQPLSLVLFDVDHFKHLNDTLGHLEGDAALAMLSNILGEGRRTTDLVARWGGEEFALLLPDTTHEAALTLAERLRQVAEGAHLPGHCTISGGVATLPDHARDERSLIAACDDALYSAKQHGRNRVHGAQRRSSQVEESA